MVGGQTEPPERFHLSADPASLVPRTGFQDQETVGSIGLPVFQRRPIAYGAYGLGVPGVVVGLYRLTEGVDILSNLGLIALGLVFAVLGTQELRMGVRVDGSDLVVRNLFSTTRIAMGDVTGIEPHSASAARAQRGRKRCVFLVVGDRQIRIRAMSSSSPLVRREDAARLKRFLWP